MDGPAPRHDRTRVMRLGRPRPVHHAGRVALARPFVDPSRHRPKPSSRGHGYVSWHAKAKGVTGLAEWSTTARTRAGPGRRSRPHHHRSSPSLAIAPGLRKRLCRLRAVRRWRGWPEPRQAAHRPETVPCPVRARRVNRFVVHARRECYHYTGLRPAARALRVRPPANGATSNRPTQEAGPPFLLAMDRPTGISRRSSRRSAGSTCARVVVTSPRCLDVERARWRRKSARGWAATSALVLAQQARLKRGPDRHDETALRCQVTVVEAMCLAARWSRRLLGTEDTSTRNAATSCPEGARTAAVCAGRCC